MDTAGNGKITQEGNNYLILKGRFKSNSLNFYGLILLIFNTRKELDTVQILVSTFSSTYDLEPYIGWEKYEEYIINAKWQGSYHSNMTVSIEEAFKRSSFDSQNQLDQLYDYLSRSDYDNIDRFMFELLNRIIHDKNLIIETNVQESTESEFRETKENKNQKSAKPAPSQKKTADEGVTLLIQLILAPVSGKPIYELKIGDIIMCKIIANTDRANYFIDLLDLRVESVIKPVPCRVIDIKSEGKGQPLEILTEIGPGIYGRCIEDERQVKLRMYDPSVDGTISKKNIQSIKKENSNSKESTIIDKIAKKGNPALSKVLYIVLGVVVIVVLLTIIYNLLML